MRTSMKLLTGVAGESGGISYLFQDLLSTNKVAPLGSPLAMEPGPGNWIVVDTVNTLSKSSGEIVQSGTLTAANDPSLHTQTSYARLTGRAFLGTVRVVATNCFTVFGYANANNSAVVNGIYFSGGTNLRAFDSFTSGILATYSTTTYQFAVIHQTQGMLVFAKGGALTTWTLLNAGRTNSTSPVYPAWTYSVSGLTPGGVALSNPRQRDLAGAWATDWGLATFTDTTLVSGDTFTGTADGIHQAEINALPGAPSANDEALVLRYRRTDDNNCWKLYLKRNAGNTQWTIILDSVSGGTPTNRIAAVNLAVTLTGVIGIGVIVSGTTHQIYCYSLVDNQSIAAITQSFNDSVTGLSMTVPTGATPTRVSSWKLTDPSYDAELNK